MGNSLRSARGLDKAILFSKTASTRRQELANWDIALKLPFLRMRSNLQEKRPLTLERAGTYNSLAIVHAKPLNPVMQINARLGFRLTK